MTKCWHLNLKCRHLETVDKILKWMTKCQHLNLKCRHLEIVDKIFEMNDQVLTPELEVLTLRTIAKIWEKQRLSFSGRSSKHVLVHLTLKFEKCYLGKTCRYLRYLSNDTWINQKGFHMKKLWLKYEQWFWNKNMA